MKKLLYIANFDDTNSINGGYTKVANEFKRIFNLYNKEDVDCITGETFFKHTKPIENYDKVLFLIHPSQALQFKDNIAFLLQKIKKRFLHIFWETDPIPSSWKPLLNSFLFNGFIVSSKFNYDLMHKETKCPIYLLPVPVDEKEYKNISIDIEDKIKNEDKFTVLYLGQYTKRKGLEDAVVSFVNALGDKKDCRLILKYYPMSPIEIPAENYIKHLIYSNINKQDFKSNIFTLQEDLDRDSLYELYKDSSVLLFPSRGEGFGLPLIESCMVGLPVIYTQGSALKEFYFIQGYPVEAYKELSQGMAQYGYERDSYYDIPSMKSLVNNLKNCYSTWEKNKKDYYSNIDKNKNLIIEKFGTKKSKKIFQEFTNA